MLEAGRAYIEPPRVTSATLRPRPQVRPPLLPFLLLSTGSLALAVACGRNPLPTPSSTAATGASTSAPPRAGAPAPELPAGERGRLIREMGRRLEAHYVFPEVGARMAASLREHASGGDYDGVATAADFARIVTGHLRDVSHDRHAMLEWKSPGGPKTPDDERWDRLDELHRRTAGFGVVERLPGNVAHLVIDAFEPIPGARDAVTRHLSEVADADAVIVDLRENSGGDPATVALVASYLFDAAPVHLNDMWWRDGGGTDAFWTLRDVPGKRFGAVKPVFVLTSRETFSAAEELAYDLQCLHRALVVGETTKGGAHPVAPQRLSPELTLRVPTGRAINPISKTNWEGTGVTPDVPVAASAALREAHARALRAILAAPGTSPGRRPAARAALEALGER